ELMTLSANKKRVINIILNNNFLGMVRQWQTFFYGERYSNTDLSIQPDFVKICEGFGGKGFVVKTKDEFKNALKEALKIDTVSVIEVKIDRFENVLPMVPAGAAIYNMILE
ncbi:acetolactate synthase catalytic subunit, partial [Campylobacter fetus]